MPGTLFVVATPIGNLEDLTFRALRTLREVDLIAAEDTRRTSKLLAYYEVRKPLVSLREHNEKAEAPRLVRRLLAGESIALVSDAGTPGISDPGTGLVAAARAAGLKVVPIPGCSAVVAALSVSGIPTTSGFVFTGFPPATGSDRRRWFESLEQEPRAVVFLEAPHRIDKTLDEIRLHWSNRQIMVSREISKINEELVDCTIDGTSVRPQGEITVVVGPPEPGSQRLKAPDTNAMMLLFGRLGESGFLREEAVAIVASVFQQPPGVTKKLLRKASILAKRQNEADIAPS